MAAGGAFNHHQQTYVSSQNPTSSRAGGILGLKIDAALTGLYLLAVLGGYALRRLSVAHRARRLLARESVVWGARRSRSRWWRPASWPTFLLATDRILLRQPRCRHQWLPL